MKIVKAGLNKESSDEEFEDYFRRNIGKKLSDLNLPVKLKGNVLAVSKSEVLVKINFRNVRYWISESCHQRDYGIPIGTRCFWLTKGDILGLYFLDPNFYEVLPSNYNKFNVKLCNSEDDEDEVYPF